MENKQTAVEWMFEQFENGDMYNVEDAQRIKHQALAMEKEQIVDAFEIGYDNGACVQDGNAIYHGGNYYKETYKGGQDV
jgi:hypothetical protein